MRFAKQFDFHKIPEWSEHYFDYLTLRLLIEKALKKLQTKPGIEKLNPAKFLLNKQLEVVTGQKMKRSMTFEHSNEDLPKN